MWIQERTGRLAEIAVRQFNAEPVGQIDHLGGNFHTHRKDDLVECFLYHFSLIGHIPDFQIIRSVDRVNRVNPASDKPDPVFIFGRVVKFFKVFAVGSHVHIENGAIQITAGMLFGDNGLFNGIHAADR